VPSLREGGKSMTTWEEATVHVREGTSGPIAQKSSLNGRRTKHSAVIFRAVSSSMIAHAGKIWGGAKEQLEKYFTLCRMPGEGKTD